MNPLTRSIVESLGQFEDEEIAEAVRTLDDGTLAAIVRSSDSVGAQVLLGLLTDATHEPDPEEDAGVVSVTSSSNEEPAPATSRSNGERPTEALRRELAEKEGDPRADVLGALRAAGTAGLSRRQLVVRTGWAQNTVTRHLRALRKAGAIESRGRTQNARWFHVS